MKYFNITNTDLNASKIALGCMRIVNLSQKDAEKLVFDAMEEGINFFDHADIYGKGKCEEMFGEIIKSSPSKRDDMIIQSKCAIHDGYFDFSKEHIITSVEGSLKRLKTDYLDVLLLHRPDALMEPWEVSEAFDTLKAQGKVRYFGVSNQNPYQIQLLNKYLTDKIIINQLQLSITHNVMIKSGLNVNMENEAGINRDGGILDFCCLNDITIQPCSPFQYGFFDGVFLDNPKFEKLNAEIDKLAEKYCVTNSAIAIAWLLRHPAMMQPILGTTKSERMKDSVKATDITITREEWYTLYKAAGNVLP